MTEPQDVLAEARLAGLLFDEFGWPTRQGPGREDRDHELVWGDSDNPAWAAATERIITTLAARGYALVRTPETLDVAGHRTREAHDCYLMNCRDLGDEVEQLQSRLAASPAPDPGAGPDTLSRAEYARLLGVEDIARLIVSGWVNGFPVADGSGERDLVDRLRAALAPSAEPPETTT